MSKIIDAVYGIIQNAENHILVVNNIGGTWSLPGGCVDAGETLNEALVREVKEEVSLHVEVEKLAFVEELILNGEHNRLYTFTTIANKALDVVIDEQEISDFKWIVPADVQIYCPWFKGKFEHILENNCIYNDLTKD